MNKRNIRNAIRLSGAILFSWLYLPHLILGGGVTP